MSIQRKYIFAAFTGMVCASLFLGCKDEYDLPDQPVDSYNSVYMTQVVNGPVVKSLKIKDIVQTANYGAVFGGQDYPTADIPVSFAVDNSLVATYNTANRTNYLILPSTAYTLSASSSVIPKGSTGTGPLTITFKTVGVGAMDAMKTYLLPLTLSCERVKLNEALKTTYYIVNAQPDLADYPAYDRSGLSVIGFSSQEANGEGPNNGSAKFAFDGDKNTFWHTQWQGASPGPPHYIILDFGTVKTLHGISFMARQNDGGGKPNDVNVQVSLDNVSWTDAGSFNLQNVKDLQPVFLPNGFKEARYFKITINSSYNGGYSALSEIYPF